MTRKKTIVYVQDDETAFLNVDVEVLSAAPLEPLVDALGRRVSIHRIDRSGHKRFCARFALYGPRSAESAVRGLVRLIEALPKPARRLWDGAQSRVFDAGFQGGMKPHCREYDLRAETVAAIARVGGLKWTPFSGPGRSLHFEAAPV